jgi:hypothetical protein
MPDEQDPGGYFLQFDAEPETRLRVIVEEDAKTCYAYLLRDDEIVGDVWLYNCQQAPTVPEWELPDAKQYIPFANPRSFINQEGPAVRDGSLVRVLCGRGEAAVYLNGNNLHAIVGIGDFPGRCAYAAKDGPLARVLVATALSE